MKKVLILILCILPLVLFGQSYDHLSITHNRTGKNHIIKSGDRLIVYCVNSSGKKFKYRKTVLRLENEHIVFRVRHKDIINEGLIIPISEINTIKIVNLKRQIILIISSILVSYFIIFLAHYLFFSFSIGGSLSLKEEIINLLLILILPAVLIFLSYFVVNLGYKKIKNLQTEWTIEKINLP